ncbi:hypothetical protein SAMN06309944_1020 [Micrococcales bacterium KH10]|nr:hypothetical protein SAMN06309944_1020 [Micrococcales bacterium KH10]
MRETIHEVVVHLTSGLSTSPNDLALLAQELHGYLFILACDLPEFLLDEDDSLPIDWDEDGRATVQGNGIHLSAWQVNDMLYIGVTSTVPETEASALTIAGDMIHEAQDIGLPVLALTSVRKHVGAVA